MRIRSRREEGQVYPALLLAVIGGFAIAVSFVPLQNLLDQTGRADTASDSAALAAAKAHKTNFELKVQALPDSPAKVATFFIYLSSYDGLAYARANELAGANGATAPVVTGGMYNPATQQVRYTAITRQNDTVTGGDASANSKSRATAAAELTAGICAGGLSVNILGVGCRDAATWTVECTPTPVYTPPPYCYAGIDFTALLEWNIHLVENDDQFSN